MRVGLLGVDLRLRVHRPEGAETSLRNVLLGATGLRLVGTRRGAEDRTQTWRTFLTNHVRDHVLVLGERHLRRILTRYFAYHHRTRTHLALEKDAPDVRPVQRPEVGAIVATPAA